MCRNRKKQKYNGMKKKSTEKKNKTAKKGQFRPKIEKPKKT